MKPTDWQIVRATPLFGALAEETAHSLLSSHAVRSVEKGALLFQQGEPVSSFFVILDGWIKIFRMTPEGTEAVVGVFRRGESFAEAAIFLEGRYPVSAEAVTESRLLAVDGELFRRRILEEPRLALAMLASSSQHLKFLVEHIEQIKALDAPQRIADFLVRLSGQLEGACTVELPYEKSLIAKRLGMKPESLSRALGRLRLLGVIVERDMVSVADISALRRYAEASPVEEIV